MSIVGSDVTDPNFRLRFSAIIFIGVILFGVALSWRSSLLFAAQYQELPVTHEQLQIKKQNLLRQKSLEAKLIQTEE